METILYYTLPEEDFACLPLRSFLSTLLANVVCKPILDLLSDPDFINLQVARLVRGFFYFFLIISQELCYVFSCQKMLRPVNSS